MNMSRAIRVIFAVAMMSSVVTAQNPPAAGPKTQQIDEESTKIFSSLQKHIKSLPSGEQNTVTDSIDEIAKQKPALPSARLPVDSAIDLIKTNVQNLSLDQKMRAIRLMIDATSPKIQQVVNPLIIAQPVQSSVIKKLTDIINGLDPSGPVMSPQALTGLFTKALSVGRIIWTYQDLLDKGDPMWQLAGTGFVTSPGVITTACHVVNEFSDVSAGQVKIRTGVVVRMEFSDSLALQRLIPITMIVAISATAGCDAAQLALDGGADLVPLKMAAASNATKRVLVVGYPLLDNYTGDDCNAVGINTTDAQFCNFHKDNPSIAKVISPGSVLTCCASDHGGVSVITYNAPTDGGQSGSPVFDADTLAVVGVHLLLQYS
jgi:hypothetical protein